MSDKTATTRRNFMATSVALTVPTFIPASFSGRTASASPSERITLGVIGIGPRCTYDLQAMLPQTDVQCVAIADVQATRRDEEKALVDKHYGNTACRLYSDFRELLDRSDIDAVLVATGFSQ